MIIPNAYPLCLKEGKSIDHPFIHSEYAREVWAYTFMEVCLSWVLPRELVDLVRSWNVFKISKKGRMLWKMVYPAVCWTLWLERNQRVFETKWNQHSTLIGKLKIFFVFGVWGVKSLGITWL